MKAPSALSAKRLATSVVAGLSAVALLGGCGFATRQQAAAIVNGVVIHQDDIQKTTEQLNAAKLQASESQVVNALITKRLFEPQLEKSGHWKPDATYAQTIATIPDATETTKEVLEFAVLSQSPIITQADIEGLQSAVKSASVTVNPKYGTFQRTQKAPFFTLEGAQPGWIVPPKPSPTPTAQ